MEVIYGLVNLEDGTAVPVKVDEDGRLLTRESAYASIVDSTSSPAYIYMCEALPGTALSTPGWRICRMENATGITTWADGNANFDNVAASRATLAYS